MSWDIKYRPRKYSDVLDQDKSVAVLKQTVKEGKGFHSSYLFAGLHGGGKTTLARILARALLCSAPVDGEPCDECASCKEILARGSSESFIEIDAATNSGKDDIRKILEEVDFSTFSGRRRIYLLDESHQLSKDALDALLKPIEDSIPGSEDRKLVCLFCTTEPEKMRATIGSRCGPTFSIKTATPETIAERLAWILEREGKEYELDALVHIAQGVDGHIRDAIRAIEMLSLSGPVTLNSVVEFLGYNLNPKYLGLLSGLKSSLPDSIQALEDLLVSQSPGEIYSRLSSLCLMAYKVSLGITPKDISYWDAETVATVGRNYSAALLTLSETFATKPRLPSREMLECDLILLHRTLNGLHQVASVQPLHGIVQKNPTVPAQVATPSVSVEKSSYDPAKLPVPTKPSAKEDSPPSITDDGQSFQDRFRRPERILADTTTPMLAEFVKTVLSRLESLQA